MKFRERRYFTAKETGARRKCSFLHGQLNHIANKKKIHAFAALTHYCSERCATIDAVQAGILDHVYSKTEALRLAVDAAVTVLRVDQIIMYVSASRLTPPTPMLGHIVMA